MTHSLFTSESVSVGHADKVADQISDTILDACLSADPLARVECDALVTRGLVVLSGEITTTAQLDYQELVRQKIQEIGYTRSALQFDYRSCGIILAINKQSPEIAQGISEATNIYHELGAGDQGMMFGYACEETPELMPLPIMLAHGLVRALREKRQQKIIPHLRPDAKSQVTVEYDEHFHPIRLHTVVISTQHDPEVSQKSLKMEMEQLIRETLPPHLVDNHTLIHINPIGSFVNGGPAADSGLTGRKNIVDAYGGMGRHGGGALSGKDPTKVDRSGSYVARYIAKNIVAAKLARRCEIQLSYIIGIPYPISIRVDTFGTGVVSEDLLARIIPSVFQLTVAGIIEMLNLRKPIYQKTAFEGHFGRDDPDFTWEKTDRIEALLQAVNNMSVR